MPSTRKPTGRPGGWTHASCIDRYRLLHRGFNTRATDRASLDGALAEHLAILDTLEARDGAAARRLMVAHIAAWQANFIRHVHAEQGAERPPRGKRGSPPPV